jgi:hypothetical protein
MTLHVASAVQCPGLGRIHWDGYKRCPQCEEGLRCACGRMCASLSGLQWHRRYCPAKIVR